MDKTVKGLIKEILKYIEETAEDFSGEFDMGQSFEEQLKEPNEDGSYRFIPEFYFKLNDMLNKTTDENGEIK